jgi:hypothetical protein
LEEKINGVKYFDTEGVVFTGEILCITSATESASVAEGRRRRAGRVGAVFFFLLFFLSFFLVFFPFSFLFIFPFCFPFFIQLLFLFFFFIISSCFSFYIYFLF